MLTCVNQWFLIFQRPYFYFVKKSQFKRIGFLIGFTLLFSIGLQAWRMVSQFEILQNQLIDDIQKSLDNAVESYFAEIATTDIITVTDQQGTNLYSRDTLRLSKSKNITQIRIQAAAFEDDSTLQSIGKIEQIEQIEPSKISGDFFGRVGNSKILFESIELSSNKSQRFDSIFNQQINQNIPENKWTKDSSSSFWSDNQNQLGVFLGKNAADSLENVKILTNKIIISITRDSLDLDLIKGFLGEELARKAISIQFQLTQLDQDDNIQNRGLNPGRTNSKVISRSTFLPRNQSLQLDFENTTGTILRRGIFEILMSLGFLGIMGYAFGYLYRTIQNQKEIAKIKQDLISNITHEFKTPIATTFAAIEGIEKFNPENDLEKTSKYLQISQHQLLKLNQMVEKLLETAILDSGQLVLQKEAIEVAPILRQLIQKFQILAPQKSLDLILPAEPKTIFADLFHFENAISNLLDNAIKYGGNQIQLSLEHTNKNVITVQDNGGLIPAAQKDSLFEQFYRIPKGDIHDVKGFGIGLYYVQQILEKHGGKIELETALGSTSFITYWP